VHLIDRALLRLPQGQSHLYRDPGSREGLSSGAQSRDTLG
jgi:hypothetical protein